MVKIKKIIINLIFSFVFAFALVSCSNIFNNINNDSESTSENKMFAIYGGIGLQGAVPQGINNILSSQTDNDSRSVYPGVPEIGENYVYKVWAKSSKGVEKEGTVTGSVYTISDLTEGSWTIYAGIYKSDDDAKVNPLMYFESSQAYTLSERTIGYECPIALTARQNLDGTDSETGKFKLTIVKDDNVSFDVYEKYYEISSDGTITNESDLTQIGPLVDNKPSFFIESGVLKSGVHDYVIDFYKKVGTEYYLIYEVREKINIFDNLTTDTFVNMVSTEYLKFPTSYEKGYICITNELIDNFEIRTIYVDNNSMTGDGTVNSSKITADKTANTGTIMKPYQYLDSAIDKVNNFQSINSFTIHIVASSKTYNVTKTINGTRSVMIEGEGKSGSKCTTIKDISSKTFLKIDRNAYQDTSVGLRNVNYIIGNENKSEHLLFYDNMGTSTASNLNLVLDNVKVSCDENITCKRFGIIQINSSKIAANITNCDFEGINLDNTSGISGAILNIGSGVICNISNTTFTNCDISCNGDILGGIINTASYAKLSMENVAFTGNTITSGGVIHGGLLYWYGTYCGFKNIKFGAPEKQQNIISAASGISGALVYNNAEAIWNNCTFTNCSMSSFQQSTSIKGAICNHTMSDCNLVDCKIYNIITGSYNGGTVQGFGAYADVVSAGGLNPALIGFEGTTWFEESCDIYLHVEDKGSKDNGKIKILGNLNPKDQNNNPKDCAAVISTEIVNDGYETDQVVLTEETGTNFVRRNSQKFALKTTGLAHSKWYISNGGKIYTIDAVSNYENYDDLPQEVAILGEEDYSKVVSWCEQGNTFGGKTLKLVKDITLQQSTETSNGNHSIGYGINKNDLTKAFRGNIDGNGCTVTLNGYPFVGFIAGADFNHKAVIKNIKTAGSATGAGLIGKAFYAKIENCENNAQVNGEKYIAGILSTVVSDSRSLETKSYVDIVNCINRGDITATSYVAGGIVAMISQTALITKCYNEGTVTSRDTSGGIVGNISLSQIEISNCYNTGRVISITTAAGGVIGACGNYNNNIYNCYNAGEVSSNDMSSGGICASFYSDCKIYSCVNFGKVYSINQPEKTGGCIYYGVEGSTYQNLYSYAGISGNPEKVIGNKEDEGSCRVYSLNEVELIIGTLNANKRQKDLPWFKGPDGHPVFEIPQN